MTPEHIPHIDLSPDDERRYRKLSDPAFFESSRPITISEFRLIELMNTDPTPDQLREAVGAAITDGVSWERVADITGLALNEAVAQFRS